MKKFRVREFKCLELVELDADGNDPLKFDSDFDGECEIKHVKRTKRKREVKPRKVQASKSTEIMDAHAPASPELDTVRIYFDCRSFVNLDEFIPFTANKSIYTCIRDTDGNVAYHKERFRNEMRCSWYGKMQVSKETKKFGKNGKYGIEVLCFEYSVAKWYHCTSGLNSGIEPSAKRILIPCIQAMQAMKIELFASVPFRRIVEEFVDRAEIRRFDLSLNFQVPKIYEVDDYVNVLERCWMNRQKATREGDGSISYGTAKSPYRVIWYNKEKEQKKFYLSKDPDPHMKYVNEDGTEEHVDYNALKKNFWELNADQFEGKLRFEVQFRTKFIQENNLESTGMANIDNIIRVGVVHWRDVLEQFNEQLNRSNFQYGDDAKDSFAKTLEHLDDMLASEVISRTVRANMSSFLLDCYNKGWRTVHKQIGANLFCQKRKWLLTNCDYDVKILPEELATLPIMRIM